MFQTIYINSRAFELPANVNQLTAKQYLTLVEVLPQNSAIEAKMKLFFALLEMPQNRKNLRWFKWQVFKLEFIKPLLAPFNYTKIKSFDIENLYDAIEHCTNFFYNDPTPIAINPLKQIKRINSLKKDNAREDAFGDFTIFEFSQTEQAYQDYTEGDENGLTRIIEILYNYPKNIHNRSHSILYRMAILLYYENARGYLFSQFPETFPVSEKSSSKKQQASDSWKMTIHFLANEDATRYQDVAKTQLWDCLYAHEQRLISLKKK